MVFKTKSSSRPSSVVSRRQTDSNLSPVKKTLDEWVQVISEACRQSFDDHLNIENLLLAAEISGLSRSEIRELREKRLPLSPSDYSKYKALQSMMSSRTKRIGTACQQPSAPYTSYRFSPPKS
jgi:hypothetical protein